MDEVTAEQLAEFTAAFSKFDRDNKGTIATAQLGLVTRSLGQSVSKADLQDMIINIDPDGKGTISFAKFLTMLAPKANAANYDASEEEIKEAFKAFDRNGSGHISGSELQHIMKRLGEKLTDDWFLLDEMIAEADKDGDGEINYEEFLSIMSSK
jgi:calmodulin